MSFIFVENMRRIYFEECCKKSSAAGRKQVSPWTYSHKMGHQGEHILSDNLKIAKKIPGNIIRHAFVLF
jgi:hypothetical protein